MSLDQRIALVTGAGSGIGRAIARRLAADRARVAVGDIDPARAAETVALIAGDGGSAVGLQFDVSDFEQVKRAVRELHERWGDVDILVNNAGWDRVQPFVENTPDLWQKVIAINLSGPIHCCRAVLDGMIARRAGKIVSISSDAGRVGSSGEAVYSACKGGVIAFSKTLARELARYRINVNVVAPGPTDTPLLHEITQGPAGAKIIDSMTRAVPFRRLATPDEIAAAVAFFASADADFITGQVLSVSGGLTMAG
ncbi:MAG TPA: 3-oxoacyl-ACP reductase FabG [Candidatus Kryptonia bacterium]|nr:3-oxoacyl-ACP reductase FabG [Candidatus Kryptonia bacterium]